MFSKYRHLFLVFVMAMSASAWATVADTSYTVNIRTDSTINVRLYFITQSILRNTGHGPMSTGKNGQYGLDTSMGGSFFQFDPATRTSPILSGRVQKIQVKRKDGVYSFAPVNPAGMVPFWFTFSDMNTKVIPDSDLVYLRDAIVNQHTFVLHRVIKYVAANSGFDNSFCGMPNGITNAVTNSILSGSADAFGFSFADSPMGIGVNGPLVPTGGICSWKLNRKECNDHVFRRDSAKAMQGDGDDLYWPYDAIVPDSFYQFIFPAEIKNGKLITNLESLLALGPARPTKSGTGQMKFQCPLIVWYAALQLSLSPVQLQIVDRAVHGDFSSTVVDRLSESYYTFSREKDTALTRVLLKMIEGTAITQTLYAYLDPQFTIRASRVECEALASDSQKIIAFNVVRYWYRTDSKSYANDNYVLCIGAVIKDSLGQNKTLCYWPFNIQLRNAIGEADFKTLVQFIGSNTWYKEGAFRVIGDSLLLYGTSFYNPVNLFDEYKSVSGIYCRYLFLDNDEGNTVRRIYLVRMGNERKPQNVSSDFLLPTYVGTYNILTGPFNASLPQDQIYSGTASIPFGFGYADTSGLMIIPPQFQTAALFSESRARVSNYVHSKDPNKSGFKYTFIDSTGKVVGEYKYDEARDFQEGRAAVFLGDHGKPKWGFVDLQMNEVVPCQYLQVRDYKNGCAAVRDSTGWFFIDKNGKPLNDQKYVNVHDFEQKTARVVTGKKYNFKMGLIDSKGKEVVPVQYDTIGPLSEGLRMVKRDSLYGFMNNQGKMKIPMKYDGANSFLNGCASVSVSHRWGFISAKEKVIVPFSYDWAGFYSGGLYAVKKQKKWGMINAKDSAVVPFQYDSLGLVCSGNFIYRQYGNWYVGPVDGSWFQDYNSGNVSMVIEPDGSTMVTAPWGLKFYNTKGKQVGFNYSPIGQTVDPSANYFSVTYRNAYMVVDREGRMYFLPN